MAELGHQLLLAVLVGLALCFRCLAAAPDEVGRSSGEAVHLRNRRVPRQIGRDHTVSLTS